MTRKRSSYRPRAVIQDTMSYIKQGHEPIASDPDTYMRISVDICDAQIDVSTRADFEKARAVVKRMGCEV